MKNLTILFISLGSSWAIAQTGNTIAKPTPPTYENCRYFETNNAGVKVQKTDTGCVANENRNYNAKLETWERTTRIIGTTGTTISEPKPPVLATCDNLDYACQSENQSKVQDYNIQKSGYSLMKYEEQKAIQAAAKTEAEKVQVASATEALQTAVLQSQSGSAKAKKSSSLFSQLSAGFSVAFAASCLPAGNCYQPLLAAAMATSMFSSKTSNQASALDSTATDACSAQNSISAGSSTCSGTLNAKSTDVASLPLFDDKGKCIGTNKELCATVTSAMPAGANLSNAPPGSWKNVPFTIDPKTGIITTKDGKTYRPSDFENLESLKAAGFSDEAARAALAAIAKATAPGTTLGDLNSSLASNLKSDFDPSLLGSTGTSNGSAQASGDPLTSGPLSTKDIAGYNKNRVPAGAGLTRTFNGEAIGAAGDDIFSMMNRRYKVKLAQDTFLGN